MGSSIRASDTSVGRELGPSRLDGLGGPHPRSDAKGVSAARSSSLWRDGVRRLRRNRLAVAGGVVVGLLCLIATLAAFPAPRPYPKPNSSRLNEAPPR